MLYYAYETEVIWSPLVPEWLPSHHCPRFIICRPWPHTMEVHLCATNAVQSVKKNWTLVSTSWEDVNRWKNHFRFPHLNPRELKQEHCSTLLWFAKTFRRFQ